VNYQKIYSDFIASRKAKGCDTSQYFENHHILPRSLGGLDDASNLIQLTPEDHYFAHLCLAKIYGGNQWAAVFCMAKMTIAEGRRQAAKVYGVRRMVDVARREFAAHQSESKTGKRLRHTKQAHSIYNIDGRSATGTLVELNEILGINMASLSRLASKSQGRTYNGWYMFQEELAKTLSGKVQNGQRQKCNIAGHNKKLVRCKDTGEIFESVSEASQRYNCYIGNALYKKRAKAAGMHWEFV